MRLILAVSDDNILALGPNDDMSWTPPADKRVFRLLTSVGGVYGAGRTTFDQLPELPGRHGVRITRSPELHRSSPGTSMSLGEFAYAHPDAWLLGGPTVALEALSIGMVDQVYLCRNQARFPMPGPAAIHDAITPWLMSQGEKQNAGTPWTRAQRIPFGDVIVDVWKGPRVCPTATARAASGAG